MPHGLKVLAMWVALLWTPLTTHCQLEELFPSLTFLQCDGGSASAPHQAQDCQGDPCSAIESGHYVASVERYEVPPPAFRVTSGPAPAGVPALLQTPAGSCLLQRALAPPGLAVTWQFRLRAAPSPRAPSFLL